MDTDPRKDPLIDDDRRRADRRRRQPGMDRGGLRPGEADDRSRACRAAAFLLRGDRPRLPKSARKQVTVELDQDVAEYFLAFEDWEDRDQRRAAQGGGALSARRHQPCSAVKAAITSASVIRFSSPASA